MPTESAVSGKEFGGRYSFKRYTHRARTLITEAHSEARRLNHPYLGTEHLLLAIVNDTECNAAQILANLGIDQNEIKESVTFFVHQGEEPFSGDPPHTPRLNAAIELSEEEARSRGLRAIGSEDLLFGLLSEAENVAARILLSFEATAPIVRNHIMRSGMQDRERDIEAAGSRPNILSCRIDDRDLSVIDALVEAGIRKTRSDAASWLIHAGIEANRSLVEKVDTMLVEIRRLRREADDTGCTDIGSRS